MKSTMSWFNYKLKFVLTQALIRIISARVQFSSGKLYYYFTFLSTSAAPTDSSKINKPVKWLDFESTENDEWGLTTTGVVAEMTNAN